jgi:hypothetical protein
VSVSARRFVVPTLLAVGIVATAVAGAAIHRTDAGQTNGLRGRVFAGPTTPVCRPDIPCEAPAPGVTLVFQRRGSRILTVKTDADGWYRATLPAAIYVVETGTARRSAIETLSPRNVKVRLGHVDRLDFHIDTGIR